jgi:hypothetical protein
VLKARDCWSNGSAAPGTHKVFSSLVFRSGGVSDGVQLADGEEGDEMDVDREDDAVFMREREREQETGGWLENDDIEDF